MEEIFATIVWIVFIGGWFGLIIKLVIHRHASKAASKRSDAPSLVSGPFGAACDNAPGLEGAFLADASLDPHGRPPGWIPLGEGLRLHAEQIEEQNRKADENLRQMFQ